MASSIDNTAEFLEGQQPYSAIQGQLIILGIALTSSVMIRLTSERRSLSVERSNSMDVSLSVHLLYGQIIPLFIGSGRSESCHLCWYYGFCLHIWRIHHGTRLGESQRPNWKKASSPRWLTRNNAFDFVVWIFKLPAYGHHRKDVRGLVESEHGCGEDSRRRIGQEGSAR